jgi:hypothetical protein
VADTPDSLQAEVARLLNLMTEARASGAQALADILAVQAARYLVKIADMRAAPAQLRPTAAAKPARQR